MKKIISIMLTVLLLFVAAGTYGCYKKEVYGDLVCGIRGGEDNDRYFWTIRRG